MVEALPMPEPREVAHLIARVEEANKALRSHERAAADARAELADAIREAADAGVSFALLARAIGVSRQRVSEIARRAD